MLALVLMVHGAAIGVLAVIIVSLDASMRADLEVILRKTFGAGEFTALEVAAVIDVGPTVPYGVLRRMVAAGVLTSRQVDGPWNEARGGRPRTYYRLVRP